MITPEIAFYLSSNLKADKQIHSPPVKSKFYILRKPLTDIFSQDSETNSFRINLPRYSYHFKLKVSDERSKLWLVFITYKRKNELVKGATWVIERSNSLLLVAKTRRAIFGLCERAFNHLFPEISQFYLTRIEFIQLIKKYENQYQYNLVSSNYTLKRSKSSGEGEKRRTTITYTTKTNLGDIFDEADAKNMWISTLQIYGTKKRSDGFVEIVKLGFGNNTKMNIKRGYAIKTLEFFQTEIETVAIQRYKLLRNRSRSKTTEHQIKPLILEFEENVFESKDKIDEFLETIVKYKNSQYSIIHSGNPHLFMTISDTKDSSTLNIKSVGLNLAVIIPQIRTSASSLLRFISFIIKNYGECKISESISSSPD